MGRGTSKAGSGGGGGNTSVTQILDDNGKVAIDLSQMPLVYGQKDAALSQAERTSIEAFENKRYTYKTEYGYAIDANGNLIGQEIHGGRGSVRMPFAIMRQAKTFSHNHPRGKGEEGTLGGTFSNADMQTFANNQSMKTMRATALEGTYSITKGTNFNNNAFKQMARSVSQKHMSTVKMTQGDLYRKVANGSISVSDYYKGCRKAFNKGLIDIHNDMLAGQKQYGYTYTLEKRG